MKLNEITKLSEFMEVLEWQFNGHGIQIIDWDELTDRVMSTFSELKDDLSFTEDGVSYSTARYS